MSKYNRRTEVVDAVQWNGTDFDGPTPEWIVSALLRNAIRREGGLSPCLVVDTYVGDRKAFKGDWIMRRHGRSGYQLFVLNADDFREQFEAQPDAAGIRS